MLSSLTLKLISLLRLMAPEFLEEVEPEVEEYDDYVIIEFPLKKAFQIEDMMDIMEDDMDLFILYHCLSPNNCDSRHHLSAISDTTGDYIFKVNCVSDSNGLVNKISITLYSSIEQMLESVQGDLVLHEKEEYSFIDKLDDGTLTSFFSA